MKIINTLRDSFFTKEIEYIDEERSLQHFVNIALKEKNVSVDTEFIWRNTYLPKLSLIQIATPYKIYLIDCLSLVNLTSLKDIFENDKITKVIHSIRSDASVIRNCINLKMFNVFDTQIAENLIIGGENQISYKNMVQKYFYRNLSKTQTNSNWEKRPLSYEQISYAAEDVRYLLIIKNHQKRKLEKKSLLENFNEKCNFEKEMGETDLSVSRLRRLKRKNKNLSSKEEEIFVWREKQARISNIPPNKIFNEKDLKKLKIIVESKNFDECRWIIKSDNSREDFYENFG